MNVIKRDSMKTFKIKVDNNVFYNRNVIYDVKYIIKNIQKKIKKYLYEKK